MRQAIENGGKPDPEVAEALARIYLGTFRLIEAQEVLASLGSLCSRTTLVPICYKPKWTYGIMQIPRSSSRVIAQH